MDVQKTTYQDSRGGHWIIRALRNARIPCPPHVDCGTAMHVVCESTTHQTFDFYMDEAADPQVSANVIRDEIEKRSQRKEG